MINYSSVSSSNDKLKCCVKTTERMNNSFSRDSGVMQGDNLSPSLFALYINETDTDH